MATQEEEGKRSNTHKHDTINDKKTTQFLNLFFCFFPFWCIFLGFFPIFVYFLILIPKIGRKKFIYQSGQILSTR